MPTVPRVERQIQERPAPTPNLPFGDTPEISGIGQPEKTNFNMEGVNKIADALIQKEIERVDEAVGLDNDLKMSITADAIEESAKRHKGRDAGLALDESRKNFADASEKIRKDSVKTRGQEDRFNRSLARNTLKLETNIGSHVSREHDSYYKTAYEASKARLKDEAGKNPEIFDANMKKIAETNRKFKETNGLDDDWLKNTTMKDNADMVENAIKQHENNDNPQAALDVFNKHKGNIPEKDRLGVGERLKKETDKKQGRDFAISIYTKEKTTEQLYAETDKWAGSNEDRRDAARREVDRTTHTAEKSKKQTAEAAWNLINLRAIEIITKEDRAPNENDFSAALRKGIADADSEGWRKQLEAWKRSPRSKKELNKYQEDNFGTIVTDVDNYPYYTPERLYKIAANGDISYKQATDLIAIIKRNNISESAASKDARKRITGIYDLRRKSAGNDEAKILELKEEEATALRGFNNLIQNNKDATEEDFIKGTNEYIRTVVAPAEADWAGWILDGLNPSGAPFYNAAEARRQRKLKETVGEPLPKTEPAILGVTGEIPTQQEKRIKHKEQAQKPKVENKAQGEERVKVISPTGKIGTIPKSEVAEALNHGWKLTK